MTAAICARRTLEDECAGIQDKQLAAQQFHWEVQDKIDECSSLRDRLRALVQNYSHGDTYLGPLGAVSEQLVKLNTLLQKVEKEQQSLEAALTRQVAESLTAQSEANRFIEAAFVHDEALPPWQAKLELPITPRDVDEEIWKLKLVRNGISHGQTIDNGSLLQRVTRRSFPESSSPSTREDLPQIQSRDSSRWPEDTEAPRKPDETTSGTAVSTVDGRGTTSPRPVLDPSTQEALRSAYFTAKDLLLKARERYEARESNRECEIMENNGIIRKSEGLQGIPWEEFDLLWLQLIFKVTRELVDAEEAVRDARVAAIGAGCDLSDHDATSIFDNGRSEGYSASWEEAIRATAPVPLIEAWVSKHSLPYDMIREKAGVEAPDIDSWEGAEPEPWESWSASAEPKAKMKIAKWQQACCPAE